MLLLQKLLKSFCNYWLIFLKCDSTFKSCPEKRKINNDTKHLHANSDPAYLLSLKDRHRLLVKKY